MVVLLKPTLKCTEKCLHCYENWKRKEVELSSEEAVFLLKRLQEVFNFKHATLVLHGGEPLIKGYEFFKELLESLKGTSYEKVSVQTGLPEGKDTEKIVSLVGSYSTSFEYPIPLHNGKVLERIKEVYKRTGIKGHVINVLWKRNEDIPGDEVYRFYKERHLNFRFNYLMPLGNAATNWQYIGTSVEKWLRRLLEIFDSWFLDENPVRVNPLISIVETFLLKTMSTCFFSDTCYRYIVSVDPDGEIYQCGRFYDHSYGNIKTTKDFESVKYSSVYRDSLLRERTVRLECRGCNFFYICRGGCKMNSMIAYGSFEKKDPNCRYYKVLLEYIESRLDKNYYRALDWLLNYIPSSERRDVSISTVNL